MKYLLIFVLLLCTCSAWAQTKCFKAYDLEGNEIQTICKGQRVRFKDCTGKVDPKNEYYDFEYSKSEGIPILTDTIKFHTYDTPGTYRVLQIANQGGASLTDTLTRVFMVKDLPAPMFTAAGCGNRQVRVSITDKTYDAYTLDLGNGTTETLQSGQTKVYTYTSDGPYTLTLTGSYTGATCRVSSEVTVQPLPIATPPKILQLWVQKEGVQDGSLRLNIELLLSSYLYIVERATGTGSTYTAVDTIKNVPQGGSITYDLNNLNTTEASCYRIRVTDVCGSTSVASTPVCLVKLQATAGNEKTDLNWQHMSGNTDRYEVYRDNALIKTLPNSARTYTDTEIKCGNNICYTVRAVSVEGSVSISTEKCVNVTSTITPVSGTLFSTFNLNNQVELTFQVPQGQETSQVVFQRSIEGSPYQQLAIGQQLTYTDQSISPSPVCYRAGYINACGTNSTQSNPTCPVLLLATAQEGGPVLLVWTGFVGFPDGVGQYALEFLDQAGNIISSVPVSGNTYTDRNPSEVQQVLRYRIKATSRNGAAISYSNIVTIEQPRILMVPSAFTPNGDGLNDVLVVKGRFFENYRITIYNSMGNVVYQGNDRNAGWDGTFNGREMPAGAYAYDIQFTTTEGASKRRTGTVTLLR